MQTATTRIHVGLEIKFDAKKIIGPRIPFNLNDPVHPNDLQQRVALLNTKLEAKLIMQGRLSSCDFKSMMTALKNINILLTESEKLTVRVSKRYLYKTD